MINLINHLLIWITILINHLVNYLTYFNKHLINLINHLLNFINHLINLINHFNKLINHLFNLINCLITLINNLIKLSIQVQGVPEWLIQSRTLVLGLGASVGDKSYGKIHLIHIHFDFRFWKCPIIEFCLPNSSVSNSVNIEFT